MYHVSNSLIMSHQENSSDEEADVDNRPRVKVNINSFFNAFCVHLDGESGVLRYSGQDVQGQGRNQGISMDRA